MKKNSAGKSLALVTALLFTLPLAQADGTKSAVKVVKAAQKATTSAKSAEDIEYEKKIEAARISANEQAKLAAEARIATEKQKAEEAAEQKRKELLADKEKSKQTDEEAKKRDEQIRLAKIEEEKRIKSERERSCVIKPVMTDAEIANCKKVWH